MHVLKNIRLCPYFRRLGSFADIFNFPLSPSWLPPSINISNYLLRHLIFKKAGDSQMAKYISKKDKKRHGGPYEIRNRNDGINFISSQAR
jgi:hypothetical protein